jgi:mannose-6-phosphate isomerase
VNCPYFITNIIALQDCFIWKKKKEYLQFLCVLNGQFEMVILTEKSCEKMGDTILIPAIIEHLTLKGKATY